MAVTTVVDFNLSDSPVFITEKSVFNLVVASALSLIGIIQYIRFKRLRPCLLGTVGSCDLRSEHCNEIHSIYVDKQTCKIQQAPPGHGSDRMPS